MSDREEKSENIKDKELIPAKKREPAFMTVGEKE